MPQKKKKRRYNYTPIADNTRVVRPQPNVSQADFDKYIWGLQHGKYGVNTPNVQSNIGVKDRGISPNARFMYPQLANNPQLERGQVDISNQIIEAALPIPGIGLGKVKQVGRIGTTAREGMVKGTNTLKGIKNLPNDIKPTKIKNLVNREKKWLTSEERIARKAKATGMTRGDILKESDDIIKELDRTNIEFLDESSRFGSGRYFPGSKKRNPNIKVYNEDGVKAWDTNKKDIRLAILDHEVKHAGSELAIDKADELLKRVGYGKYGKYPRVKLGKWYDRFNPFPTRGAWINDAAEQQVVSKRIMDYVEQAQGIKRGSKLTDANINDMVNTFKTDNVEFIKNYDVATILKAIKKKEGTNWIPKVTDMVNKAYVVPPASIVGSNIKESNEYTPRRINRGY